MRVFSYGGGVQSTAALVLAAQGQIAYPAFLFCNVGDDSEHPDSLKYVREVAMPYAKQHNIELIELHRILRTGETETLYGRLTKPGSRSIGIPVRMNGNGAPGNRACTADFKIHVVDRWLREHDAKKTGAIVGLGISLDEIQRMKPNVDANTNTWKRNAFPLLMEVPQPLTRQDCINIIVNAGLPIPPKSACYFCPYHRLSKWQEMRQKESALFEKAASLEELINERRSTLGLYPVWFTRKLVPLQQATTALEQGSLFDEDEECEGYCFV
jgi:hypothetical protein